MIDKFKKIFNGLEERFGYHIIKDDNNSIKKSGESKTSHYPHTNEMWQAHLNGEKFTVNTKHKDQLLDNQSFFVFLFYSYIEPAKGHLRVKEFLIYLRTYQ